MVEIKEDLKKGLEELVGQMNKKRNLFQKLTGKRYSVLASSFNLNQFYFKDENNIFTPRILASIGFNDEIRIVSYDNNKSKLKKLKEYLKSFSSEHDLKFFDVDKNICYNHGTEQLDYV